MIRWLISSALQFRFLVIVLAAVLVAFGVSELQSASINIYPEFNPPLVEIQTEALGLSAAEMEALITVPLEADLLNGVAWLDRIYSESVTGLSSILLVFEPGTDPIKARQMVQERLTQTFALPNVSTPPTMLQPLSATNRVMIVGLSSQDLSLIEMSVLARWNIKPRLMGIPGVANVALWGQREWQLQVQVDPARLQEQDVTLQQVIETTGEALWVSPLTYLQASKPGTAGWIDTPNQRLGIRHLLPIDSPEDLARVSVVDHPGLQLGEITNVVDDHQPLIGDAFVNDGPGLLLVIEKFPGANVLDVTEGVNQALEEMRPGLTGIEIDSTVFRPATYIEDSIDNLTVFALISAGLVAVMLGILFFDWRAVAICLVVIPLSLLVAALVLYEQDVPFNLMILAGLTVALVTIVNDVILDVENIIRHLHRKRIAGSDKSNASIVLEASVEVRTPIIFTRLALLLTVLPIVFIEGLTGSFLDPFTVAYLVALLASLAIALIVTPALSLILFSGTPRRQSALPMARWLQSGYQAVIAKLSFFPTRAIIVVGVVIVIGLGTIPMLEQTLMPSLKQTDLLIEVDGAPGTSRTEMNRVMALASQELRALDGVRNVGFHVGRAVTGDLNVGVGSGEIWLSLDSSADYDKTVAAIQDTINGYPGLSHDVQTYQPERLEEALVGIDDDVVVRVYGHEFDVLETQAEEIAQGLLGIDGVAEARVDYVPEGPQVEIETQLSKVDRYGLKPGDVRRAAAILLSGLEVGSLYQDQRVFGVVVWGAPEIRENLTDVRNLLIDIPDGGQIALGEVADVRIVPSPTIIQRDAVSRFIDIDVTVSGRTTAAVASDIDSYLASREFPFEYHAAVQGDIAERQATQIRVVGAIVAALLGIFLLLQAVFGSWRLAFVAMLTMPMALAGGLFAAVISGGEISLGSLFGLLAVLGIAIRNGVVLTTHIQRQHRESGGELTREIVLEGAGMGITSILMTALVIGLIYIPMVVAGNVTGVEMLRPMAIVILGGLVTSTVLALFILPTLYLRFGPQQLPEETGWHADEMYQQPVHG